jgi:hypothetical protein
MIFHRQYRRGFTPSPFLGGMPLYKVLAPWLLGDETDADIYQDVRDGLTAIVGPGGPLRGRHIGSERVIARP